jgi:quercetin dioxygenase-like cupin family protein
MKRSTVIMALLCTLTLVALGGAKTQDKIDPKQGQLQKREAVFADSADNAKYREVAPGVSKAVIWGDPDKRPYGAFTKFAPGLTNALHTHTNDLRIVVVKGVYIYKPESGDEIRVGPGSFLMVPGGVQHVCGGDSKEGATFYEESINKFDLVVVETKK